MSPLDRRALDVDLVLYVGAAAFALFTGVWSTLAPHREWGLIAVGGYLLATTATLLLRQTKRENPQLDRVRLAIATVGWFLTCALALVIEAVRRVGGHEGHAQEEVAVVELAGRRLWETGSPYLSRADIADSGLGLLGYVPYSPGMALFGLPRAWWGEHWWTDARVAFALVTVAAAVGAFALLRTAGAPWPGLVRGGQALAVLPIVTLTLATGGDDLPVLALAILGLAFAYRDRWLAAGFAVGAAASMKLMALPVVAVLLVLALMTGARHWSLSRFAWFTVPAVGLPVIALIPALLMDASATAENLIRFPAGHGLVASPAESPLPGRLIAIALPHGRTIATILLLCAAGFITVRLVRRPPADVAQAALVIAGALVVAICLAPTTRFGYLLYPAAFALWALALRAQTRGLGWPDDLPEMPRRDAPI